VSDASGIEIDGSRPFDIVLATANPYKAAEIGEIFGHFIGLDLNLLARPVEIPEVEETGTTLVENARLKAAAITRATKKMSVADDTGLFVDALDGAPGVHSARYAGDGATDRDNVERLLVEMDGVENRRATFRTVALAISADGGELVAMGEVHGTIAVAARGNHGFGYDPVFIPDELAGQTFAELETDEKHTLSHRGRAFRALAAMILQERLRDTRAAEAMTRDWTT